VALAFVAERAKASGVAATSFNIGVSSVAVGNILVLGFSIAVAGSGSPKISGVTDNGSNTWNSAWSSGGILGSTLVPTADLWFAVIKSALSVITVSMSASIAAAWKVEEFSGFGTLPKWDTGTPGEPNSSTAQTSAAMSLNNPTGVANPMMVCLSLAGTAGGSFTGMTGFTQDGTSNLSTPDVGFWHNFTAASGLNSETASWTTSEKWAGASQMLLPGDDPALLTPKKPILGQAVKRSVFFMDRGKIWKPERKLWLPEVVSC
jgi:hypothetical protein